MHLARRETHQVQVRATAIATSKMTTVPPNSICIRPSCCATIGRALGAGGGTGRATRGRFGKSDMNCWRKDWPADLISGMATIGRKSNSRSNWLQSPQNRV